LKHNILICNLSEKLVYVLKHAKKLPKGMQKFITDERSSGEARQFRALQICLGIHRLGERNENKTVLSVFTS
jgi:hypothetical protein